GYLDYDEVDDNRAKLPLDAR
nr:RecName: Full=Fibrinogen beta chain; Contains: RecName: Full=Fibrinopeptide B [Ovis aries]P68117.1 RecName: Full=Fibrinogen beta chain; Contains: RecName: Full=Fibrinopeptide B [Capra hircus]prf//650771Y fibrinopeptide B [Capra hircus]